jgi:hypothetical protein
VCCHFLLSIAFQVPLLKYFAIAKMAGKSKQKRQTLHGRLSSETT